MADVAVAGGRIAYVGRAAGPPGPKTEVVDATGRYLSPGFIEPHAHPWVLYNPVSMAEGVLPRGATIGLLRQPLLLPPRRRRRLHPDARGPARIAHPLPVAPAAGVPGRVGRRASGLRPGEDPPAPGPRRRRRDRRGHPLAARLRRRPPPPRGPRRGPRRRAPGRRPHRRRLLREAQRRRRRGDPGLPRGHHRGPGPRPPAPRPVDGHAPQLPAPGPPGPRPGGHRGPGRHEAPDAHRRRPLAAASSPRVASSTRPCARRWPGASRR